MKRKMRIRPHPPHFSTTKLAICRLATWVDATDGGIIMPLMNTKWILGALAAFLMVACDDRDAGATASIARDASVFDAVFVAEPSPNAMHIHEARESAKPGDEIILQGRVMGRVSPFVDGRAAFVLGDPTLLTPCNEKPDDGCPTPWDVCCDSADAKRKGTATIQIVGDDGRVIAEPIREVNGLVELSTLTVRGTVADGSSAEAFIVNAESIHVRP